jgi:hypothetical protein
MATTTQSYASHAHRPTLTTIAGLFAFIALALVIRVIAREPTIEHLALLSLNCSAIALVLISRAYTVRLQDRIIRLEMHGRLDRLGRAADFGRLSIKQLTALRFASDRELPALLDRTLTENLAPDQIKRAVTDWQPDLYRT